MSRLLSLLKFCGVDLALLKNNISGLFFYFKDLRLLKSQKGDDKSFVFGKKYPILFERFAESGNMKGHYFHQDLYVAKRIFNARPEKHLDIGSRIDGFVAHLAVFRQVEVLDIRPLTISIKNVSFQKADLMRLPQSLLNYCDSISSLHAIEHFGLGRYGDPIDYFGHLKAIANITKILKPGGVFYFSAPIGKQRIEFNAHRVFSIQYLLDIFKTNYTVKVFSYIDDAGDFFEDVPLTESAIADSFGCNWGCGIFELVKN